MASYTRFVNGLGIPIQMSLKGSEGTNINVNLYDAKNIAPNGDLYQIPKMSKFTITISPYVVPISAPRPTMDPPNVNAIVSSVINLPSLEFNVPGLDTSEIWNYRNVVVIACAKQQVMPDDATSIFISTWPKESVFFIKQQTTLMNSSAGLELVLKLVWI